MNVECPTCGKTLSVGEEMAGKKGKCPGCGTILTIPESAPLLEVAAADAPAPVGSEWAQPGGAPAPVAPPAPPPAESYQTCPFCAESILATAIKCKHCGEFLNRPAFPAPPAGGPMKPAGYGQQRGHSLQPFPTAVLILIHFLTFGLSSWIWQSRVHGNLPKIRPDDPSAGKALGFLFIPFYNYYWVFFTCHRLCVRLNEQRAQAGLAPDVPTGLAIGMCILLVIPYIGLLSVLFLMPVFVGIVQSKVNELARAAGRP